MCPETIQVRLRLGLGGTSSQCTVQDAPGNPREQVKAMGPWLLHTKISNVYYMGQPSQTINLHKKKKKSFSTTYCHCTPSQWQPFREKNSCLSIVLWIHKDDVSPSPHPDRSQPKILLNLDTWAENQTGAWQFLNIVKITSPVQVNFLDTGLSNNASAWLRIAIPVLWALANDFIRTTYTLCHTLSCW